MVCGVAQTNKTTNCWLLPPSLPLLLISSNDDLTCVTEEQETQAFKPRQTGSRDTVEKSNIVTLVRFGRFLLIDVHCQVQTDMTHCSKTAYKSFAQGDTRFESINISNCMNKGLL